MSQAQETKALKAPKTDHPVPYLAARREWDERYGAHISQARNWRMAALVAFAVAAASVAGVVHMGSRSSIQPFVVAIDDLGSPVAVGQPAAVAAQSVDERIKRAQLANWIFNVRTIVRDAAAQQVMLDRVYAMASERVAADLNAAFATSPPFGRRETVSVTIRTVLHQGGNTWQVTWTERIAEPGQAAREENWRAVIEMGVDANLAASEAGRIWNPLGIFIVSHTWQREV